MYTAFGDNLKRIRTERGLTLEQLGKMVGKGKSTLSKYERSVILPGIFIALRIADALGVTVEELARPLK